jgi:hypothetical protein
MCLQMAFNSYQLYAFVFLFVSAYILLMSDMEIRKRVVVSLFLSGLFLVSLIFYYCMFLGPLTSSGGLEGSRHLSIGAPTSK